MPPPADRSAARSALAARRTAHRHPASPRGQATGGRHRRAGHLDMRMDMKPYTATRFQDVTLNPAVGISGGCPSLPSPDGGPAAGPKVGGGLTGTEGRRKATEQPRFRSGGLRLYPRTEFSLLAAQSVALREFKALGAPSSRSRRAAARLQAADGKAPRSSGDFRGCVAPSAGSNYGAPASGRRWWSGAERGRSC
ncbi:hypothetical protein AOLI_G00314840 [Acnodon oligacanthus]